MEATRANEDEFVDPPRSPDWALGFCTLAPRRGSGQCGDGLWTQAAIGCWRQPVWRLLRPTLHY